MGPFTAGFTPTCAKLRFLERAGASTGGEQWQQSPRAAPLLACRRRQLSARISPREGWLLSSWELCPHRQAQDPADLCTQRTKAPLKPSALPRCPERPAAGLREPRHGGPDPGLGRGGGGAARHGPAPLRKREGAGRPRRPGLGLRLRLRLRLRRPGGTMAGDAALKRAAEQWLQWDKVRGARRPAGPAPGGEGATRSLGGLGREALGSRGDLATGVLSVCLCVCPSVRPAAGTRLPVRAASEGGCLAALPVSEYESLRVPPCCPLLKRAFQKGWPRKGPGNAGDSIVVGPASAWRPCPQKLNLRGGLVPRLFLPFSAIALVRSTSVPGKVLNVLKTSRCPQFGSG